MAAAALMPAGPSLGSASQASREEGHAADPGDEHDPSITESGALDLSTFADWRQFNAYMREHCTAEERVEILDECFENERIEQGESVVPFRPIPLATLPPDTVPQPTAEEVRALSGIGRYILVAFLPAGRAARAYVQMLDALPRTVRSQMCPVIALRPSTYAAQFGGHETLDLAYCSLLEQGQPCQFGRSVFHRNAISAAWMHDAGQGLS